MRKYLPTDLLIYKNIETESDKKIVFISGLGLDIRKQREGFIRRFALNNGVSYLALDCTKFIKDGNKSLNENISQILPKTLDLLSHDNKDLLLLGCCFGGDVALRIATKMPDRVKLVLATSPSYETPDYPWIDKAESFLKKREEKFLKNASAQKLLPQLVVCREIVMAAFKSQCRQKIDTTYQGDMYIFHGEKDRLIPKDNSLFIQQALHNPKCKLHISPIDGHTLQSDYEFKLPIKILKEKISSISGKL